MICENCSKEIPNQLSGEYISAHSSVAVLQYINKLYGYKFYQCEDGQPFANVTYQHYHCSHNCMLTNMISCINNHYSSDKLNPIPIGQGSTILDKIILGNGFSCSQCQLPLTFEAYRFCLVRCTPINAVHNGEDDSGWCCSYDHAKQQALQLINTFQEL